MKKGLIFLAAAIVGLTTFSSTAYGAGKPVVTEKIFFQEMLNQGTSTVIASIEPDGSNHQLLSTQDFVIHLDPQISPKGDKLAYTDDTTGSLVIANPDGSNPQVILKGYRDPKWFADGRTLLVSAWVNNQSDLFIVRADGKGLKNITNTPNANETDYDVSSTGQIIFNREEVLPNGTRERGVYVMNADGSGLKKVYSGTISDPEFSPDGTKVVFGSTSIGMMDMTNFNISWVVVDEYQNFTPTWSPDGQKIAYVAKDTYYGTGYYLRIVNADGTNKQTIYHTPTDWDEIRLGTWGIVNQ